MVPGVAERGAMFAGCFGSMFPRPAGESSRLAESAVGHPHPALRADLSLEGEGFAGEHPHPSLRADLSLEGEGLAGSPLSRRGGAGERRNFVAWPSWP